VGGNASETFLHQLLITAIVERRDFYWHEERDF
jgi:hypothetical protein